MAAAKLLLLINIPFSQHLLTQDSDWGNPTDNRHNAPNSAPANGEIRETMALAASPAVQQRGGGPQVAADTVSEHNTRLVFSGPLKTPTRVLHVF